MTRFSFTQPICNECYMEMYPGREAAKIINPENEKCCKCGREIRSGIYVRVDPATVPFPTRTK